MTDPQTCWVIERYDLPLKGGNAPCNYFSWSRGYFTDDENWRDTYWDDNWERALKFFDRESCEMICADMPFEWDVKIMEHQVG